jgi:AraC-like DNA-binding protein
MTPCELQPASGIPSLVNLDVIERKQRAAAWHTGARTYFPGMSVHEMGRDPTLGSIAGASFGAGRLWTVLSPPLQVNYDPAGTTRCGAQLFSLMLQLSGSTLTRQQSRSALLNPGDMCVVDGCLPFEMTVDGQLSHIIVIQMPRHAVLGRHPYLEHRTAETFDSEKAGCALLRSLVLNVLECAQAMEPDQCSAALNSVIHLLGAPRFGRSEMEDTPARRVRAALAYIEAHLADSDLNARRIADAQGVSRRRLDEIMVKANGASVNSLIWSRRLEQAASDLLDDRFACGTITDVAYAAGFEDLAHFTRSFKRRYLMPPSKWREEHGSRPTMALPGTPKRRRN